MRTCTFKSNSCKISIAGFSISRSESLPMTTATRGLISDLAGFNGLDAEFTFHHD